MKIIKVLLIIGLVLGCEDNKFITEYYENGNLKLRAEVNDDEVPNGTYEEYYPTGELLVRTTYTNGKTLDTIYTYHKNGVIQDKGMSSNNLNTGWWSKFDATGRLKEKREFVIVDNRSRLNQKIVFDKRGDTIYTESSFFKLYIPDTLKLGKNVGRLKYNSEFKSKDKFYLVLIDNQISESEVHHDTFPDEPGITRFGIYAHKSLDPQSLRL